MPRQAHGRSLLQNGPAKTKKRKPARGRGLNALETAEKQFPDQFKIRQHRLGEAEDDDDAPNNRQDVDDRSAKRRKIDNTIDEADSAEEGSDLEGGQWHVGVNDEEEDSDIDSDEAFGESDEERFVGFTFRGSAQNIGKPSTSKTKKSTVKQLDLGEDDEDEEEEKDDAHVEDEELEDDDDDLGEDAVDLAAALDMNEEEERKEKERKQRKKSKVSRALPVPSAGSSEVSAESDADDESASAGEQDDSAFEISEDEADQDTTARLQHFIAGLTPAEVDNLKNSEALSAKRNIPSKPSQFGLPATGLSAADLMQYIKDPTQRQSLKILQAAEREGPQLYKGGIPGKLAAPLAKRQQDRLDRLAAYEQSKKTLDRWVDTVKQNRRAEHVSFAEQDAAKASATNVKSFQPLSNTQPQSALESKIQEIMRESGYNSKGANNDGDQEQQYEELQEKKMPLEEVQARRRELRMQRELMFREEVRAKRIKKIKSKAYRRVHRKERDKVAVKERERLAAAGILNSDDEREQNDRHRAEERMGARHRESRWAKAAKATGQTTWNEDAKIGVSELARREEELRRRIEGKNVQGSDDSGSESESEYSDSGDEKDDFKWNQKLDALSEAPVPSGKSRLADMAFMKKAEAARQEQNDTDVRLLRQAMNGDGDNSTDEESEEGHAFARQKYGNTTAKYKAGGPLPSQRNEFEAPLSEDEDVGVVEKAPNPTVEPTVKSVKSVARPAQSGNGHSISQPAQPTGNRRILTKSQGQSIKSKSPASISNGAHKVTGTSTRTALADYASPLESEKEDDGLDDKDRLALDIFAGDDDEDIRKSFAKEKKQAVEEEGDQVVDNSLPGWGSWTGAGLSKKEQKKAKGRAVTTIKGIAPEARKDAKLDRVIVNEKRIKKNDKYLATELPHPFESRQQYERSLRLPMGPEWSTRNHFQQAIKPRVLLKQGHAIKPMAKPKA